MTDISGTFAASPRQDIAPLGGNVDIKASFQTVVETGETAPATALARINDTVARLLFGPPDPASRSLSGWSWPGPPEGSAFPEGGLTATLSGGRLTLQGRQFFRTANQSGDGALLLVLDADPAKGGYIVYLEGKTAIQPGGLIFNRAGFQFDELILSEPLRVVPLGAVGAHILRQKLVYGTLVEELLHAALDYGIVRSFSAAAHSHITTRTRAWQGEALAKATDDPHLVRRYGEYVATRHALEELITEARDAVARLTPQAPMEAIHQAGDAVAAARMFALLAGRLIINGTLELLGAGATSQRYGFDGYWRDFSAHGVAYPPRRPLEKIGRALVDDSKREVAV
ncbi:hypothetical protein ABK905_11840 [Acerihabitans sp. KWT182]|uniref:Acyl-CoA dehydrogenase n=1 Tax=Acerihabitans sp. KWT182 TaxID=3157919 RepID=A0AAU7QFA1_9GAMM